MAEAVVAGCEDSEERPAAAASPLVWIRDQSWVNRDSRLHYTQKKLNQIPVPIPNRSSLLKILNDPTMLMSFRFQLSVTSPQSDGEFVPPFSRQQSLITQNAAAPIQYDQDVTPVSWSTLEPFISFFPPPRTKTCENLWEGPSEEETAFESGDSADKLDSWCGIIESLNATERSIIWEVA